MSHGLQRDMIKATRWSSPPESIDTSLSKMDSKSSGIETIVLKMGSSHVSSNLEKRRYLTEPWNLGAIV